MNAATQVAEGPPDAVFAFFDARPTHRQMLFLNALTAPAYHRASQFDRHDYDKFQGVIFTMPLKAPAK